MTSRPDSGPHVRHIYPIFRCTKHSNSVLRSREVFHYLRLCDMIIVAKCTIQKFSSFPRELVVFAECHRRLAVYPGISDKPCSPSHESRIVLRRVGYEGRVQDVSFSLGGCREEVWGGPPVCLHGF